MSTFTAASGNPSPVIVTCVPVAPDVGFTAVLAVGTHAQASPAAATTGTTRTTPSSVS